MPAANHTYLCTCTIYPDGHHVRKTSRIVHNLEIKHHEEKAVLEVDLSGPNPFEQESSSFREEINDTSENISELLSGLTLSHNVPIPISNDGTGQNKIPMADLQTSVHKLLKSRFPKSPSKNASSAAPTSHSVSPLNARDRKHHLLLDAIENETKQIICSLDRIDILDHEKLSTELDQLAEKIRSSGVSLASSLKNPSNEISFRKQTLIKALRSADMRITQLGALIQWDRESVISIAVDSGKMIRSPVANLDTIAQITLLLGTVTHFVMGLSGKSCDFILGILTMLIQMSMAIGMPNGSEDSYNNSQTTILNQLPTTLCQALGYFQLDSDMTIYAACPSCNFTHRAVYDRATMQATYPDYCTNIILTEDGRKTCGSRLLEGRNEAQRPLKPFVSISLKDYLSRVLTDSEAERLCKKACDDAFSNIGHPSTEQRNIFESSFIQSFKGPDPSRLFIDRGDAIRLVLGMHVDFFNPDTERRAATKSIGVITLVIMNLPEHLRYKPEFIFPVGIIPGPHEPPVEQLNHYIRPIIDEIRAGWTPGYHLSNTADSPIYGEHVDVALLLSINDLPAARKVSGTTGVAAHIYCTVCDCRDRDTMYRTDFEKWPIRNAHTMRQAAESWRDAETLAERERIEHENGVRWSELWRLPYWDPTRMLVIDSMHCVLEGLVHYHCRHVLCLDSSKAKIPTQPAFTYPWAHYEDNSDPEFQGFDDKDQRQIISIQDLLERPFGEGSDPLDEPLLEERLTRRKKNALKFVLTNLNLHHLKLWNDHGAYVLPTTKKHFAKLLVQWRLKYPLISPDLRPKTCDMDTLRHVQHVIKTTDTPSWIHSVPSNYGEAGTGIIKAGEWRILSTVHIPIALITLWGDEEFPNQHHFLKLLDHSMSLFEAVTLMVRNTMTCARATRYRDLLQYWVDNLYILHPHTASHRKRPNVHAAFHIYDFLLLFGPVMSWWTYPFERLIGVLQRINTNNIIGGTLERTMLESYTKGANLRWWLRRPDCPEVIRQFKILFDKAFSSQFQPDSEPHLDTGPIPVEVAHYRHNGVNFSRAKTHMGNSLILYYPTRDAVSPIVGSIQKITTLQLGVRIHLQQQAPLRPGQRDPFARYPSFPGRSYSAEMEEMTRLDVIELSSIVTHVARYKFRDRAIIIDLSRV